LKKRKLTDLMSGGEKKKETSSGFLKVEEAPWGKKTSNLSIGERRGGRRLNSSNYDSEKVRKRNTSTKKRRENRISIEGETRERGKSWNLIQHPVAGYGGGASSQVKTSYEAACKPSRKKGERFFFYRKKKKKKRGEGRASSRIVKRGDLPVSTKRRKKKTTEYY